MAGGNIPQGQKAIFIAAGRQYGIPASVLAGIASVESNLGSNASTSSAGAVGEMQFLPSTAQSIGVNPYNVRSAIFGAAKLLTQFGYKQNPLRAIGAYNGGPGNPQYGYANQVMAEAKRLAGQLNGVAPGQAPASMGSSGFHAPQVPGMPGVPGATTFDAKGYQQAQARALLGNLVQSNQSLFAGVPHELQIPNTLLQSGVLTTGMPDPSKFLQTAQNSVQQLAGQAGVKAPLKVHPGSVPGYKGYINPIAGFTLGRTDQGVDASANAGRPIRALGDSRLVQVLPDWYAGQPLLLYKILNGPKAGQYWYVAEQIHPTTTQIGHVFHTGDVVGTFAPSGTGIEIGWGSPTSNQRTLAGATTGYTEGQVTPAGSNFRNFLGSVH